MGSGWPAPGVNNAPEYIVSAFPWVSSSVDVSTVQKIEFPNVTKYFKIANTGAGDVAVGFTETGTTGDHKFIIRSGSTETFDLRIREIWISGSAGSTVDILGGLTSIPRRNYQKLTGSNPPPEGTWYLEGIE